jgi:hypothetical protein
LLITGLFSLSLSPVESVSLELDNTDELVDEEFLVLVTSCKLLRDVTLNAVILVPTIQQIMQLQQQRKIGKNLLLKFPSISTMYTGLVAQSVEHSPHKWKLMGSHPDCVRSKTLLWPYRVVIGYFFALRNYLIDCKNGDPVSQLNWFPVVICKLDDYHVINVDLTDLHKFIPKSQQGTSLYCDNR